ncbi:acetaldehyde dehydrogenase (acetylating) [Streptomyces dioscori]|uniref:Acetaldehyde dehydrogenase n=1 Tax=Streptomyces dioscori TaxID=2109333 RepID=A0A2P8Q283_9ACTN|nr:acetylating acetaldehyde dehydrogenase [Streptomyces dioscori]PSM40361.1 acetaldehyde dehydrogenase (acetylating) [Streptomyces dioscori]
MRPKQRAATDVPKRRTKVAVIGSGNIGTDLVIKILRLSETLEIAAMAGVDPDSDGLARARRLNVATTHRGVEGLMAMDEFADVQYVFAATSAGAQRHHDEELRPLGRTLIDLTPAAVGPYVVSPVNGDSHLDVPNVNMVTCGGRATIPVVGAINQVSPVHYGEIVASVSSRSAGPGTRANIDERPGEPLHTLAPDCTGEALKVSVFLEVEGAANYLPAYAGNLDIMTSAALRTAERMAAHPLLEGAAR